MDLLNEWVGRTIEQELEQAVHWRESDDNRSLTTGRVGDLTIEDDGSNLRVTSPKPRVVQIIKFEEFKEPYQATVSDGITRINVQFSSAASQRYTEKTKRNLSHGTIGGLFQLLDFQIVATALGPRPNRLTLYVNDFKSLGGNGSGQYGLTSPHGIESRVIIKDLIEKLRKFRKQESTSSYASPSPSLRSQLSNASPISDSYSTSQPTFATQPPLYNEPVARSSKLGDSGKGLNVGFNAMSDFINDLDPFAKANGSLSKIVESGNSSTDSEKLLATGVIPQKPVVNGEKGPANSSEALLGLLGQPKKKLALEQLTQKSIAAPASILNSKECLRTNQECRGMKHPGSTLSYSLSRPLDEASPREAPGMSLASGVIPGSIETVQPQNQTQTRKRISSRDIRIPTDQEALLDSQDSWIPAEPGRREPVANIPISILESVNRDADLRALAETNSLKCKRASNNPSEAAASPTRSTHDIQDGSPHDSESDIPVSSGQWPPSPERDQLPPDSTGVSADHSDRSEVIAAPASDSGTIPMKSLNESPASSPVKSMRPSLRLRLCSSQSSVQPSSSTVSNSAGEEGRLYRCRAVGCEKSYTKDLGLTYHTERYHSDRYEGPQEKFKCTEDGCNKSYTSCGGLKYHIDHHHNGERAEVAGSQSDDAKKMMARVSTSIPPFQKQALACSGNSNVSTVNGQHGGLDDAVHAPEIITASANSSLSSPDSDLEIIAPHPLNEKKDWPTGFGPMQCFPSTACQPEIPFTQVERTPYPNGQKSSDRQSSPSKIETHPLPDGSLSDSTSHVTLSLPSTLETTANADIRHDGVSRDFPAPRTLEINPTAAIPIDIMLPKAMKVDPSEQLGRDGIRTSEEKRNTKKADAVVMPQALTPKAQNRTEIRSSSNDHANRDGKRKDPNASFMSPNFSKRRKIFNLPPTFDLTDEFQARRDPSEGAREIRQEFLASRKSSENSTPMQSPTRYRINGTYSSIEKPVAELEMTSRIVDTWDKSMSAQHQDHQSPLIASSGPERCPLLGYEMDTIGKVVHNRQATITNMNASTAVSDGKAISVDSDAQDAQAGSQNHEDINHISNAVSVEVQTVNSIPMVENIVFAKPHPGSNDLGLSLSKTFKPDGNVRDPIAHTFGSTQQDAEDPLEEFQASIEPGLASRPLLTPLADFKPESESAHPGKDSVLPEPNSKSNSRVQPSQQSDKITPSATTILDSEVTVHPTAPKPASAAEIGIPSAPAAIFEKFKDAYPTYPGDMKHFVASCRKISNLVKTNQMEHQFLWDDFIVRHKVEYGQYLRRCAEGAEDARPFEEFYHTEIEEPQHSSGIVTRRTLEQVLSLVPQVSHPAETQPNPQKEHQASTQPRQSKTHSNATNSTGPSEEVHEPPGTPSTLDLTGENRQFRHANLRDTIFGTSPTGRNPRSGRFLPWSQQSPEPGNPATKVSHGSSQHARLKAFLPISRASPHSVDLDASTSLDSESDSTLSRMIGPAKTKVERKCDKMIKYEKRIQTRWGVGSDDVLEQSHFGKLRKRQLKFLSQISGNVNLEEGRRLLRDTIHKRTAPNPSKSMPRIRTVDLKTVRDATFSEELKRRERKPAGRDLPTRYGSETHHGALNKYQTKIQVAWNISPNNILKPEYYNAKTSTPRVLQLFVEIADMVDVDEARELIKMQIDARKAQEVPGATGSADRHDKLTLEDLEAVKSRLAEREMETSSWQQREGRARRNTRMSFTRPFSLPHTNVANEKRDNGVPDEWFKDDHTPFRTFARAYALIRPGSGNSFASDPREQDRTERGWGREDLTIWPKKINILRWEMGS